MMTFKAAIIVYITLMFTNGRLVSAHECATCDHIFAESCYSVSIHSNSWTVADDECLSIYPGGYLLELNSDAEGTFVATIPQTTERKWIGGSKVDAQWTWTFSFTPIEPLKWTPGEPTNEAEELCLGYNAQDDLWFDGDCATGRPFICEFSLVGEWEPWSACVSKQRSRVRDCKYCSCGDAPLVQQEACCKTCDHMFAESCYTVSDTALSWSDADNACISQSPSGKLLELNSDAEDTFVTTIPQTTLFIWMGGTKASGRWRWSSSNTLIEPLQWAVGEPDNEICMYYNPPTIKWGDSGCTTMLTFMCELPLLGEWQTWSACFRGRRSRVRDCNFCSCGDAPLVQQEICAACVSCDDECSSD